MLHPQFSKLALISCITLSLSLSACHDDKTDITDTVNNTDSLIGIWQAPAYGYVLYMQANTHQLHQVTSKSCQRFELDLDHDEFVSSIVLSNDESSIVSTFSGLKDPGMVFGKESSLPDLCVDDLTANKGEANYQFDAQRDFEIFWQNFSQY